MGRLLAYMGNDPQRVRCALHPGRDLLQSADARGAVDGWGLGFYQGGEVLLQRRPKPPATPIDFFELAKDLRTDAIIAHMRTGTHGTAKNENTHPFRFRSWLFAHHGTIAGFDEHRAALLGAVPEHLARNIRGQTDSEFLFHLFLGNLHAANRLDDPLLSPRAAGKALVEAMAQVTRVVGQPSTLDVAATNGRILLVTRRGLPLSYYRVDGIRDCSVCRESPGEGRDGRPIDHDHLRAVVFLADGDAASQPRAPWAEVPEDHMALVSHELGVEMIPLGLPG